MSMILFYLILVFFLKKKEEKVMLCVSLLTYILFLYVHGVSEGCGMILDDLSFSMVFLSIVLMIVIFMSVGGKKNKHYHLCMGMFTIVMYFMVENLFVFFILFEFSLLPVFILITMWGSQPERMKAVKFMMMYTLIASSPFLFYAILLFGEEGTSLVSIFSFKGSSLGVYFVFISMFAFWVKIPLFFFHSWLPKAHVEAPLEGSMILAGLMLKVGMYGMIRVMSTFSISSSKEVVYFFFAMSLVGSLMSVIMAISSDDMKMSVAFSSISHMNFSVASLAGMSVTSMEGWIMVMISHGLCSPMMFYLVTKIYFCSGSRSMMMSKGLASKFPFFQFLNYLIWSVNISPPPFLSFLGEINMIFCLFSVYLWSVVLIVFYFALSSFFSMYNYGVQNHSSRKMVWKGKIGLMAFTGCVVFSLSLVFFFFFFFDLFC